MADHILGPRARFWFALLDVARAWRMPNQVRFWLLARAGSAVRRQREREARRAV